jgi:hypothetical protein
MKKERLLIEIVGSNHHKFVNIKGVPHRIDVPTAKRILDVLPKLNPMNRKKFMEMPWRHILEFTFQWQELAAK